MNGHFPSKKTIVLSKDYFNNILFHNIIKKKIIEIPPYILLPNKYNKRNIKKNSIKIGYLGRLSDEKGLEILIEASNKLLKNKYDHELIIAGDKEDKRFQKYIKKLFYKSKNNNRIKFIGKINEFDKCKFLNNLDIFILPSINSFEAFGIVQLEAMAAGLPALAFQRPRSGMGWVGQLPGLQWSQQPEDLQAVLQRLADHPEQRERLGQQARKRYQALFARSVWLERLHALG